MKVSEGRNISITSTKKAPRTKVEAPSPSENVHDTGSTSSGLDLLGLGSPSPVRSTNYDRLQSFSHPYLVEFPTTLVLLSQPSALALPPITLLAPASKSTQCSLCTKTKLNSVCLLPIKAQQHWIPSLSNSNQICMFERTHSKIPEKLLIFIVRLLIARSAGVLFLPQHKSLLLL